jgi:hypothetical protein
VAALACDPDAIGRGDRLIVALNIFSGDVVINVTNVGRFERIGVARHIVIRCIKGDGACTDLIRVSRREGRYGGQRGRVNSRLSLVPSIG